MTHIIINPYSFEYEFSKKGVRVMNQTKGLFIVFEGMEGSGKTTQVHLLVNHYKKQNKKVFVTREPGGTTIGNCLRSILLEPKDEPIEPVTELLLIQAARVQHVVQVLKPALQNYPLVICDRYTDSTLAYQGGGRNMDQQFIQQLNHHSTQGIYPDLTILLDLPASISLQRAMDRMKKIQGVREDRFEKEALEFHERVQRTYLHLAKEKPDQYFVLDAIGPIEVIHKKIIQRVNQCLC